MAVRLGPDELTSRYEFTLKCHHSAGEACSPFTERGMFDSDGENNIMASVKSNLSLLSLADLSCSKNPEQKTNMNHKNTEDGFVNTIHKLFTSRC